jgi:hypothetical protein
VRAGRWGAAAQVHQGEQTQWHGVLGPVKFIPEHTEVVPGLVEVEVAVPRSMPAAW